MYFQDIMKVNHFIPENNYLYYYVEAIRHHISPLRSSLSMMNKWANHSNNPLGSSEFAKFMRASIEMSERMTRTYHKPKFGITKCEIDGVEQKVKIVTTRKDTFCHLKHFTKPNFKGTQPKLLIIAPLSGHHATLLRGTVQDTLPFFDVWITDWIDASQVPVLDGCFDLDDFIDYLINHIKDLGPGTNVMAVCQPTVPLMVATALMAENNDPCTPNSMILIGGPIDARKNSTKPGDFVGEKDLSWLEKSFVTNVPPNYPGYRRRVYPGFLQLAGFVNMNLQNHVNAHKDLFQYLLIEDHEKADKQRKFYDEYLSVMDLPAEFYLQTIKEVYHDFSLAKGKFISRGRKVNLAAIHKTALLGIEGGKDDIAAVGQTKVALNLCSNIPDSKKDYHLEKEAGHYGVFSGSKFRASIVPIIREFVRKNSPKLQSEEPKKMPSKVTKKK